LGKYFFTRFCLPFSGDLAACPYEGRNKATPAERKLRMSHDLIYLGLALAHIEGVVENVVKGRPHGACRNAAIAALYLSIIFPLIDQSVMPGFPFTLPPAITVVRV
jgi:hypothetical protein